MEFLYIMIAAFTLNAYLCYLCCTDEKERKKAKEIKNKIHQRRLREKAKNEFFDYMMDGLGVGFYDTLAEYESLTFEELVERNTRLKHVTKIAKAIV